MTKTELLEQINAKYRSVLPALNRLARRRWAAVEAQSLGQSQVVGLSLEDVLRGLYARLGEWIAEIKELARKSGKDVRQLLIEAHNSQRMRPDINPTDRTAYALCVRRTGPELLRFFIERCPHVREALLRGELPPYPWQGNAAEDVKADAAGEERPEPEKMWLKWRDLGSAGAAAGALIGLFEACVYGIPWTWLRDHPATCGIQVAAGVFILVAALGWFVPPWRKYAWGSNLLVGLGLLILSRL